MKNMPSSPPPPTSGGISAVHPDIIQTHILTKIDGPTLASAACASPLLHALCTEEKLWMDICNSTWPSTNQSFLSDIISTFPAGHRSFFSDSFSGIDHRQPAQQVNRSFTSPQLISAVDIRYGQKVIYSKVEITETETEWFRCTPFRIDLLDRKEPVTTQVKFENDDVKFQLGIPKNMSLSWILIDPTRKRAVNLSSRFPVSVTRHWLTGDVQAEYAVVMTGDRLGRSSEFIKCSVVVTCGGKGGGDLHVREVGMHVQDMEGKGLSGGDSLVILQGALESGRRKKGNEERERYREYLEMMRESRERKLRRERRLDLLCIVTGVTIFMAFWGFILLR